MWREGGKVRRSPAHPSALLPSCKVYKSSRGQEHSTAQQLRGRAVASREDGLGPRLRGPEQDGSDPCPGSSERPSLRALAVRHQGPGSMSHSRRPTKASIPLSVLFFFLINHKPAGSTFARGF